MRTAEAGGKLPSSHHFPIQKSRHFWPAAASPPVLPEAAPAPQTASRSAMFGPPGNRCNRNCTPCPGSGSRRRTARGPGGRPARGASCIERPTGARSRVRWTAAWSAGGSTSARIDVPCAHGTWPAARWTVSGSHRTAMTLLRLLPPRSRPTRSGSTSSPSTCATTSTSRGLLDPRSSGFAPLPACRRKRR